MNNTELIKYEASNSAKSIVKTFEAGSANAITAKNGLTTALVAATPFVLTPVLWAVNPVLGFMSGVVLFGGSAIAWAGSSGSLSSKIDSHEQAMHEMYLAGEFSDAAINSILAGKTVPYGRNSMLHGMFKLLTDKRRTTRHNLDWPSYAASLFKKQAGTSKTVYPNGGGFEMTYVYKRFSIISVSIAFMNNAEDEWDKAYNQILGIQKVENDSSVSVAKVLEAMKRAAKSFDL